MILDGIIKKITQNLTRIYKFSSNKKLKKDKSILTDSDIIIQKIVLLELKKKLKNKYYLISEEKSNNVKDYSKYKYIVTLDPIDGTENFYSGLPEWGFSISIYKDLKHYESCIFLPALKKLLKTNSKVKRKNSRIKSFSSSVKFKSLKDRGEFRLFGCCVYGWAWVYLLRGIFIMSLLSGSGLAVWVLNLLLGFGLPVEGHFS